MARQGPGDSVVYVVGTVVVVATGVLLWVRYGIDGLVVSFGVLLAVMYVGERVLKSRRDRRRKEEKARRKAEFDALPPEEKERRRAASEAAMERTMVREALSKAHQRIRDAHNLPFFAMALVADEAHARWPSFTSGGPAEEELQLLIDGLREIGRDVDEDMRDLQVVVERGVLKQGVSETSAVSVVPPLTAALFAAWSIHVLRAEGVHTPWDSWSRSGSSDDQRGTPAHPLRSVVMQVRRERRAAQDSRQVRRRR